jgi:hypothetical protein
VGQGPALNKPYYLKKKFSIICKERCLAFFRVVGAICLHSSLLKIFGQNRRLAQKDVMCQVSSIIVSLVRPAQALWPKGKRKQTRDGGGGEGVMI